MVTIVIVSALSPYQESKTFKSGQISKKKNGKYLHRKQLLIAVPQAISLPSS